MNIDWTSIILAVLSLIFAVISSVFVPWMKERLGAQKYENVKTVLRTLMEAAETYMKDGTGPQKKEWVLNELKQYVKFDEDLVQDWLEAMFRELTVEGTINSKDEK